MSLTSFTVRVDQNDRARGQIGDLTITVYDVSITAAANIYPNGGEPVDFSGEFREVHAVLPSGAINPPGAGNIDPVGAMLPVFERADDNTGRLRFYRTFEFDDNAYHNLSELAGGGGYPNDMQFSIVVVGRPATDAA